MEESKRWWESLTIWDSVVGFVVALFLLILPSVGVPVAGIGETIEAEREVIVEQLAKVGIGIGYLIALYGRIRATKRIS